MELNKFVSSKEVNKSNINMTLEGVSTNEFELVSNNIMVEPSYFNKDKFLVTNKGLFLNEIIFPKRGNYKATVSVDGLSYEKEIRNPYRKLSSMDNYLIYATDLKTGKIVVPDTTNVVMENFVDRSKLSADKANILSRVEASLNSTGSSSFNIGYLMNLRTGKCIYVNALWNQEIYKNTDSNLHKTLTTTVYKNMISILIERWSFVLHGVSLVNNKFVLGSTTNILNDIDYKDGDILVFAFSTQLNTEALRFSVFEVGEYIESLLAGVNF